MRRIFKEMRIPAGTVYVKNGKNKLLEKIYGFNMAAQHGPWVVIVDLDRSYDCPPEALRAWLPFPSSGMHFRIAVRSIESWIMADRQRMARFLGVALSRVEADPETLEYPKQYLVNLARRSRKRYIKDSMVPRPQSGREVGPGYTSKLIEFITDSEEGWRLEIAAERSDSLKRSIETIARIRSGYFNNI